jgi:hypothetical protein
MQSLQAQQIIQLQRIPLIPDPENRRQYEDWCRELDEFKKGHFHDLSSRQILEDAISETKTSIVSDDC